jgi:hypothetical protein
MVVIILEQLGIIHVTEGTLVTGVLTAALATTPAMDIMLAVMRTGMWGTTLVTEVKLVTRCTTLM